MPRSATFETAVVTATLLGAAAVVATALAWVRSSRGSEHLARISALEAALQREKEARAVERAGRIALQQASRRDLVEQQRAQGFNLRAIGHVESPFPDRRGTPRQPSLVPAATAVIVFDKAVVQHDHFAELALFSHLWIIFVFHDNTNLDAPSTQASTHGASNSGSKSKSQSQNGSRSRTATAKIRPPRLHGLKVGCLSTRSPHRPNPIGLSVCEIVSVGPGSITVRGVDLVHMTPVLDVKPYIPYDLVPSTLPLPMAVYPHTRLYTHADSSPDSTPASASASGRGTAVGRMRTVAGEEDGGAGMEGVEGVEGMEGMEGMEAGAGAGAGPCMLRVPAWIYEADVPVLPVRFAPEAMRQLAAVFREGREDGRKGDESEGAGGAAAEGAEGGEGGGGAEGGGQGGRRGGRVGGSRGGPGRFSASLAGALALISQVLRQDVRGVRQGRGGGLGVGGGVGGSVGVGEDGSSTSSSSSSSSSGGSYFVHLDGLRVCFMPSAAGPLVTHVQALEGP